MGLGVGFGHDGVLLGEDDGGGDAAQLVGEEEVLVPEELTVEVGDDPLLRLDEVVLHDGGRAARGLVEEGVGHLG